MDPEVHLIGLDVLLNYTEELFLKWWKSDPHIEVSLGAANTPSILQTKRINPLHQTEANLLFRVCVCVCVSSVLLYSANSVVILGLIWSSNYNNGHSGSASIAAKREARLLNLDIRINVMSQTKEKKLTTSVRMVEAGHYLLHSRLQRIQGNGASTHMSLRTISCFIGQ